MGLAIALATNNGVGESRLSRVRDGRKDELRDELGIAKEKVNERLRILANWDPSYPTEKVDWYEEYVARHAPISTSWLQQPGDGESAGREYLEVRGMALYTPKGESGATMVVA